MSKMHSAKKLVIDFILVMLGNAIMALGTAGFAVPAKIILGGVSGLLCSFINTCTCNQRYCIYCWIFLIRKEVCGGNTCFYIRIPILPCYI